MLIIYIHQISETHVKISESLRDHVRRLLVSPLESFEIVTRKVFTKIL